MLGNSCRRNEADDPCHCSAEIRRRTRVHPPALALQFVAYLVTCGLHLRGDVPERPLEHRGLRKRHVQPEVDDPGIARATSDIEPIEPRLHDFGIAAHIHVGLRKPSPRHTARHIECRDAVLGPDGREAAWPTADAVVGNPPFVGDKKMRNELGDAYTEALRAAYKGRVPGGADLVCYWFEKARAQMEVRALQRAGLVATNSIRGGKNRTVLDRVTGSTRIFEAWSDEPWVNDGAAVRVSLVAF